MENVFEGTGVKRYVIRYRKGPAAVWEYPAELQYDTPEEAQEDLERIMTRAGEYEITEKYPCLRYEPVGSTVEQISPFMRNLLEACGCKPYIIQEQTHMGEWVSRFDLQFETRAEAVGAARRQCRIAGARCVMRYEPVGRTQ